MSCRAPCVGDGIPVWSGVSLFHSRITSSTSSILHVEDFRNLCSCPAFSVSRSDNTRTGRKKERTFGLTVCGMCSFFVLHDHFGGEISLITDAANVKDAIGQSVPISEPSRVPPLFLKPSQKHKKFGFAVSEEGSEKSFFGLFVRYAVRLFLSSLNQQRPNPHSEHRARLCS